MSGTFHDLPYNSTPRQPPGHGGCFCQTLPASTSWSSTVSQHSFYSTIFPSSSVGLLYLLHLQLTRSSVLLNLQTFQILTKLWGFLRKRKYAHKGLHGSFHAVARDSQTCRNMDRQLADRPSPSSPINMKSFLFTLFTPQPPSLQHRACLPLRIRGRPPRQCASFCSLLAVLSMPLPV